MISNILAKGSLALFADIAGNCNYLARTNIHSFTDPRVNQVSTESSTAFDVVKSSFFIISLVEKIDIIVFQGALIGFGVFKDRPLGKVTIIVNTDQQSNRTILVRTRSLEERTDFSTIFGCIPAVLNIAKSKLR